MTALTEVAPQLGIGKSRAFVLGGGGPVGVAWATGWIRGLADEGVLVTDADLAIGTSAGSIVAAQFAGDEGLQKFYEFLCGKSRARDALLSIFERMPKPDAAARAEMLERWMTIEGNGREIRINAGRVSLTAKTMPERAFVGLIAALTRKRQWPSDAFYACTVDAYDGSIRVFGKPDGVSVARACAASSSVPDIFPAITVGQRRYIDGGARSTINADLASGADRVMVLINRPPFETGTGPLTAYRVEHERTLLEKSGSSVKICGPDDQSKVAMGVDPFDANLMVEAGTSGRAQGRRDADQVRAFWS